MGRESTETERRRWRQGQRDTGIDEEREMIEVYVISMTLLLMMKLMMMRVMRREQRQCLNLLFFKSSIDDAARKIIHSLALNYVVKHDHFIRLFISVTLKTQKSTTAQ